LLQEFFPSFASFAYVCKRYDTDLGQGSEIPRLRELCHFVEVAALGLGKSNNFLFDAGLECCLRFGAFKFFRVSSVKVSQQVADLGALDIRYEVEGNESDRPMTWHILVTVLG
jgi:hypothetical protein